MESTDLQDFVFDVDDFEKYEKNERIVLFLIYFFKTDHQETSVSPKLERFLGIDSSGDEFYPWLRVYNYSLLCTIKEIISSPNHLRHAVIKKHENKIINYAGYHLRVLEKINSVPQLSFDPEVSQYGDMIKNIARMALVILADAKISI